MAEENGGPMPRPPDQGTFETPLLPESAAPQGSRTQLRRHGAVFDPGHRTLVDAAGPAAGVRERLLQGNGEPQFSGAAIGAGRFGADWALAPLLEYVNAGLARRRVLIPSAAATPDRADELAAFD